MRLTLVVIGLFLVQPGAKAQLKRDETLVFFPTMAWNVGGDQWETELHGWVFEQEADSLTRAGLLKALRKTLGSKLNAQNDSIFQERTRWFLTDNERNKRVEIALNLQKYRLKKSKASGHFRQTIRFTAPLAAESMRFTAVLPPEDQRVLEGFVYLFEDRGVGVVSDIDDTIKQSNVLDKKALIANTFCKPFQPTPGFPEFYAELARDGASFHYVSASPWQLYPSLKKFLDAAGYPSGPVHLRSFRVKDASFYQFLFHDSRDYKKETIASILKRYPNKRFILIGDAGEHDPEIYVWATKTFPGRIQKVIIRKVGDPERDGRLEGIGRSIAPIPFETR